MLTSFYRLPMGNLHVLNTINFHQQLRTMVSYLNIHILDELCYRNHCFLKICYVYCLQEEGILLGSMTVIESEDVKDSKDLGHPRSLFHFLPHQPKKYRSSPIRRLTQISVSRSLIRMLHFRNKTFKDGSTIHHLTPQTARSLLRHAVITLLAHIGFENSSDVAVETLIDVADHFLRRMTLLLKAATERKDHGFPVRKINLLRFY